MDEGECRNRRLKQIVEQSRSWDAEYLIRNMEHELDRLERGLDHMIWNHDDRPVTVHLRPLPVTPRFEVSSDDEEFRVKVFLPKVPQENISVNVDAGSVEVLACSDDFVCRPYYIEIEAETSLRPDTAEARLVEGILEVRVSKVKRTRVRIS